MAARKPVSFDDMQRLAEAIAKSGLFGIKTTDQALALIFGKLAGRWHVLSPGQWDSIRTRVLGRCTDDAVTAARPVAEGQD